jgi:hypothetical protein
MEEASEPDPEQLELPFLVAFIGEAILQLHLAFRALEL